MNSKLLHQKIDAMATYRALDSAEVRRFGGVLETLSGWDLFRINPLHFASQHNFSPASILDLFVHGAKIGLFAFEWNMFCPLCGAIVHSFGRIGDLVPGAYHCARCDMDVEADLNDFIEVAFTIDPAIEDLRLDPFSGPGDYHRYYLSANQVMPAALEEYQRAEGFRGFTTIASGETGRITFTARPGELYRLVSEDINSLVRLRFTAQTSAVPEIVDIEALPAGYAPDTLELPAGEVTLALRNHLNRPTGATLGFIDMQRVMSIVQADPPRQRPFVSGKHLLNNQGFRELFRIQALPRDLRLKVSNVTILFTDLKGSTELYERTGDMAAYTLVQHHFDLLKASIQRHGGAIVKTIGDAVMASFSHPVDGMRAAVEILDAVRRMGEDERVRAHGMAVKVGLNEGTALVVTANETLDYFGQTVNVAARVQNLASGGEIWVTEQVYESAGVREIVSDAGMQSEKKSAYLKGVSQPTMVFQCRPIEPGR